MNDNYVWDDKKRKRILIRIFAVLFGILALGLIVFGFYQAFSKMPIVVLPTGLSEKVLTVEEKMPIVGGALLAGIVLVFVANGFWRFKNWARTLLSVFLTGLLFVLFVQWIFEVFSLVFGGEYVLNLSQIVRVILFTLWNFSLKSLVPGGLLFVLTKLRDDFEQDPSQRNRTDAVVRWILLITTFSAIFIVFLIIVFTMMKAWDSIETIGIRHMLTTMVWRPGKDQFGLLPMIAGSVLVTLGAAVLGVPFSLGVAILLAEIAPDWVRKIVRPAIELLAGIPSVVYGLFGMIVLAPLIRTLDIPRNTGFGLLNASIVLAVMIMPTITNIAEDAIRAVPDSYKKGALGLGATRWQTIWQVILPAARSGIVAAVILGIGRALGETMAMIMVIGNSIGMPAPLNDNPLTIFMDTARTLTGNIAVEITYAAGEHRSALFFTGILLFLMIIVINALARYMMKERN